MHAMYLCGSGSGYSQFATVYKLTQNNSTALTWYNKWLARFHGKSGTTESWGYLSNQTATNTSYLLRFNWSSYLNGSASSTGKLTDNDDAKFVGYSNSSTLFTGTQIGSPSPKTPHSTDGTTVKADGTWTWSTPLNTTYTGFDKVTVGFSMTSGATLPSNCITVRILAGSNIISSTTTNGSSPAVLTVPTAYRSGYNLYLQVYISSDNMESIGSTLFTAQVTEFSFSLSSVNLYWSSSAQTCLSGHNWGDAVYTYSSDKKTCTVKHTCSTCGVDENETITAVQTASTTTTYTYKYTPTSISSVSAWSKTYSRDYGSGTVSFTSSSGSSNVAGTWSKTNANYTVGYSHNLVNGTWYSVTTSTVQATGTAVINKGAIKTNVQSVKAVASYEKDYMTVIVYSSSGAILKQNSGYQTVTVDLSTIDNADKLNCYVQVIHSRINSQSNYQSGSWNSFPSAPNISVTSTLSYVAITY